MLKNWWVYAICLFVCLALGFLFLKKKAPVYQVNTAFIINDNDDNSSGSLGGGLGSLMSSFSLGGFGNKATEDELYKFDSHDNIVEAIEMLGLNKNYSRTNGLLEPKTYYYNDSPIVIDAPKEVLDTIKAATLFEVKITDGGKNIKVKVRQPKKMVVLDQEFNQFPILVKTPRANFIIDTTSYFVPSEDYKINASITSPENAYYPVDLALTTKAYSKKSDIIQAWYEDVIPQRATDFLYALIDNYNNTTGQIRKEFAGKTVEFIDNRLLELYSQLSESESKIQGYKEANNIVDPDIEGGYIYQRQAASEQELMQLKTQQSLSKMVLDFIKEPANKYQMVPFTPNIPNEPITAYNALIMDRMRLEANSKGNQNAIKVISEQIDAMRESLLISLEKEISSTDYAVRQLERVMGENKSRISQAPGMEKDLTALYRDQKIKNQIYAFLLQKREENEMSRHRDVPIGRIIEKPYESEKPVSPNKILVLAVAFIFGLLMGGTINYYREGGLRFSKSDSPDTTD